MDHSFACVASVELIIMTEATAAHEYRHLPGYSNKATMMQNHSEPQRAHEHTPLSDESQRTRSYLKQTHKATARTED